MYENQVYSNFNNLSTYDLDSTTGCSNCGTVDSLNSLNALMTYVGDIDTTTVDSSNCTIGSIGTTSSGSLVVNNGISWTTLDSNWATAEEISLNFYEKEEMRDQLGVLENYFKMMYLNTMKYDRELSRSEFLDFLTNYVKQATKKEECYISFDKDAMIETINFKFDNNTRFSLNNRNDLFPETFLHFRDMFYVNTEPFLNIVKRAAFNRLLNI